MITLRSLLFLIWLDFSAFVRSIARHTQNDSLKREKSPKKPIRRKNQAKQSGKSGLGCLLSVLDLSSMKSCTALDGSTSRYTAAVLLNYCKFAYRRFGSILFHPTEAPRRIQLKVFRVLPIAQFKVQSPFASEILFSLPDALGAELCRLCFFVFSRANVNFLNKYFMSTALTFSNNFQGSKISTKKFASNADERAPLIGKLRHIESFQG